MSVSRIALRLIRFQSIDEFRADVKLMFDNARKYNVAGSLVVEDANVLEALVEEKAHEIIAQEELEIKHEPLTLWLCPMPRLKKLYLKSKMVASVEWICF